MYVRKPVTKQMIDDHQKWLKRHQEAYKQNTAKLKADTREAKRAQDEAFWRAEMENFRRQLPKRVEAKFTPGVGAKREDQKYTGTEMLGVATMHKSNPVPVFNSDSAKDISKMRR